MWKRKESFIYNTYFLQKDESKDDETNIYDFLRQEVLAENASGKEKEEEEKDPSELTPYTSNVGYLSDAIDWLSTRIRVVSVKHIYIYIHSYLLLSFFFLFLFLSFNL